MLRRMALGFLAFALIFGTAGLAKAQDQVFSLSAVQYQFGGGYFIAFVAATGDSSLTTPSLFVNGQAVGGLSVTPLMAPGSTVAAWKFTKLGSVLSAGATLEAQVSDGSGYTGTKDASCFAMSFGAYCQ